ncbi:MAG TPA: response regulator transcription factor [Anaeromyxobacteraceae bacterium]|nr:response regulator transcription factor [Anaeromyxobacteraceae bacterium]
MARILVVDDHELTRKGIESVLAAAFADADIAEASSAEEALTRVASGDWDLVIADLNLPGRDGLGLLTDLQRLRPRTHVLVVSAYAEEEFAVRCLRLGARGYVAKAAGAKDLVAAVRKVLEGGKYVTPALAERLASAVRGEIAGPPHEMLSNRELQVLRLVALGRSLKEIAAELGLSERTIATYRARLATKLGLKSSVEIARYAIQHKLVD